MNFVNTEEEACLRIKPCRSAYIVWGVMSAVFVLPCVPIVLNQMSDWPVLALFATCSLVCLYWLRCFEIRLNKDTLVYKTLFRRRISIPIQDIRKIEFVFGLRRYVDRFKPYVRLEMRFDRSGVTKMISINAKVLESKDINRLLAITESRPAQ